MDIRSDYNYRAARAMDDETLKRTLSGLPDERLDHLIHLAIEERTRRNKRSGVKSRYIKCAQCKKHHWVLDDGEICNTCRGYKRANIACDKCGATCNPTDPDQKTCTKCTRKGAVSVRELSAASTEAVSELRESSITPDRVKCSQCNEKHYMTKKPQLIQMCTDCMRIDYFTRFPVRATDSHTE